MIGGPGPGGNSSNPAAESGGEHGPARSSGESAPRKVVVSMDTPEARGKNCPRKVVVSMDTLISRTWAWAPASIHESDFYGNLHGDSRTFYMTTRADSTRVDFVVA